MKTSEEDVIGFDALYESMQKCRKGVLWKDSVAAYYHRGIERTDQLCRRLHNGTYRPNPPKHFTITSPKRREIASISIRDRVYQRSLNDNVVYPTMTRSFIYDNWACQKGKGTDAARNRMKELLRRHYRKYGCSGYVAQFDITGYYPNMRHDSAEAIFRDKLPDWAYKRVERILKDQYPGDAGYNPGSQLIQIAGISMLDSMDHFIKERLHVKLYIRYMDDFILIHPDRAILEQYQTEVTSKLSEIGFSVNPKKTRLYPLREGVTFLGFSYHISESGKIYMIADPTKVKAGRKKYRRLVAKSKRGLVDRENVDQSFRTWINHLSKGNSKRPIARLEAYYNDLWKE